MKTIRKELMGMRLLGRMIVYVGETVERVK